MAWRLIEETPLRKTGAVVHCAWGLAVVQTEVERTLIGVHGDAHLSDVWYSTGSWQINGFACGLRGLRIRAVRAEACRRLERWQTRLRRSRFRCRRWRLR